MKKNAISTLLVFFLLFAPRNAQADWLGNILKPLIPSHIHLEGRLLSEQLIYTFVIASVGGAIFTVGACKLFEDIHKKLVTQREKELEKKSAAQKEKVEKQQFEKKINNEKQEPNVIKRTLQQVAPQILFACSFTVFGASLFLGSKTLGGFVDYLTAQPQKLIAPSAPQPAQ